jgi:hypothetical protein
MTVGELIEELEKMDPAIDVRVLVQGWRGNDFEADTVEEEIERTVYLCGDQRRRALLVITL